MSSSSQKGPDDCFCKPADYSIVFEKPLRLTDIRSWHGHIPFAFYLTQALKPGLLVELGTHKGDSYCAFCQAVKALGLSCSCFAVDTWKGDEQAGLYGEDVFEEFRSFHDSRFAHFSTLIRSTFDNALPLFADGSIDLIHIDGCHKYEAIRHDFEVWLPKMSDRGVILMHDTSERDGDFGVWRLWERLVGQYKGFEFFHSHGLGVLCVGEKIPNEIRHFFSGNSEKKELMRSFFSRLGENILLKEHIEDMERKAELLESMVREHRIMLKDKDAKIENLKKKIAAFGEKGR